MDDPGGDLRRFRPTAAFSTQPIACIIGLRFGQESCQLPGERLRGVPDCVHGASLRQIVEAGREDGRGLRFLLKNRQWQLGDAQRDNGLLIVLARNATVEMCRRAFKAGAVEFLDKPLAADRLPDAVQQAALPVAERPAPLQALP